MRILSLVSLLIMSCIWSACTREVDVCGSCLDRKDVLLPLQVGNTWRYVDRLYQDSLILTVKEHVIFGGKCFAVLWERRVIRHKSGNLNYRTVEYPLMYLSYGSRGEIVSLPGVVDMEQLEDSVQRFGLKSLLRTYYDPWARIDTSWTVHSTDGLHISHDVTTISRDSAKVDISTPSGVFRDCIVFEIAGGNIHADYMAPGVGMVSRRVSELGGGELVLTSHDLK